MKYMVKTNELESLSSFNSHIILSDLRIVFLARSDCILPFLSLIILQVANNSGGRLTISSLEQKGWPELRINQTIDNLMDQGMIWIDEVDSSYWVPALFHS